MLELCSASPGTQKHLTKQQKQEGKKTEFIKGYLLICCWTMAQFLDVHFELSYKASVKTWVAG